MRAFTPRPVAIRQRAETCGCVVTERPGHMHTKMCDQHQRETFRPRGQVETNNLDLVGG